MNESRTGTLSFVEGSIHRRLHDLLEDFEPWSILRLILRQILSKLLISIHCNGNARIFLSVASTPKSHLTFLRSETRGKVWCSMHSNLDKHKHHIKTLESSRVHPQKICVIHIYNPNLLKSIHNNNHMTSRC